MPSNRTSDDIDFVPPTRKAKKPPPQPWPLPYFEPLHIANFDDHGTPNLPPIAIRTSSSGRTSGRPSLSS